ncbi:MAG: endospore germination permease [Eubacteriales bacterium]
MNDKIKDAVSDKLDPRTVIVVLIVAIVEFELFSLSRGVVLAAGRDAWLSVLLGSLLLSFTTYLLVSLAARFPRENLFQYSGKVWGKPLSYVIAISYFIFWAGYLTIMFKNSMEANRVFFLNKTPVIIPLILMAIGAVWLVSYGLPAITRFFQLMFPFLILPILLIQILSIKNVKIDSFFPIMANGFLPVLKGAFVYFGVIQSLEVLLFLSPFLTDVKKSLKPSLIGINIVNLIALSQVVTAVGILGVKSTKELIWPNASMLGYLEVPGLPIERFGMLLTLPWLVAVFTTICLVLYLLSYGIIQVFNFRNKKAVIYIASGISVLATFFIPNFAWSMEIRNIINVLTWGAIFIIPVLTLIVAILRGKVEYQP